MSKNKATPAADKKQEMLVNVILDRSGSMNGSRLETISGYNAYLEGLRKDEQTNYSVSLIQFDTHAGSAELTVSYADRPLKDVVPLTEEGYVPRGWTPLYDAIGECTRRVDAKGRPVLAVVITDGYENASEEFTKDSVKKLIAEKEAAGWKFVFLGANIDSYSVGAGVGVASNYTSNYAVGKEREVFSRLASATVTRSENIRSRGLVRANLCAMFSDEDRVAMGDTTTGGRPAAPPIFRTAPTSGSVRKWTVNQ